MVTLRPFEPTDLPAATALNRSEVPHVNDVAEAELAAIVALSTDAVVAVADGVLGGLVIVVGPRTEYHSLNYRWFSEHFADFRYLDRVVVGAAHRRRGIGRLLYENVTRSARAAGVPRICLEVNIDPPNPVSLAFHREQGYEVVEHLTHPDGHTVALMTNTLSRPGP